MPVAIAPGVLRLAYLNSLHQTGLKNLLRGRATPLPGLLLTKIDEVPFDFERRCMSVILGGLWHTFDLQRGRRGGHGRLHRLLEKARR